MGGSNAKSDLQVPDIAVLAIYFLIILAVGLYSSFKNRGSIGGYFLAGQNVSWWLVGASLFASNIGSGHFVGLAGTAASSGIAIAVFEIHAVYVLALLGWVFVPVYKSAGVFTLPEYLYKRFGGHRIRMYMSTVSLLLYIFTKISADLFSGAIFLSQSIPGLTLYLSATLLIIVSAFFTISGGLTAVLWTDFIQTFIMLSGAFILMGFAFDKVGGYEAMRDNFPKALPDTLVKNKNFSNYTYKDCGRPPDNYFHLMHEAKDPDLPWTGVVFGLTVSGVWYWCSDQVIVQRALAAKVMPAGLKGLMIAVMMSALITSLTSIFNSASTIFTIDIWTRIRRSSSDIELMIVGRLCVCVLVAVSFAWIPVVKEMKELFHYIQGITSFLAPPICAVFVLTVFWWRTTETAAFWGLIIGLMIGIIRFAWEFSYPPVVCGEKPTKEVPDIIAKVHYLHFGAILFVIVVVFTVVVSLWTEEPPEYRYQGMTYFTRDQPPLRCEEPVRDQAEAREGWLKNCLGSVPLDQQPCMVRFCLWLFGLDSFLTKPASEQDERETMNTSIYEPPRAAIALDINCFLVIVFITVYWFFFA